MSMSPNEMIAVIQAHKDGKRLQYRLQDSGLGGPWKDTPDDPMFAFNVSDYRVKPEPPKPREWWICYDHDPGESGAIICSVRQNEPLRSTIRKQVHVREVLPEQEAR
jgi:hypothetical protein